MKYLLLFLMTLSVNVYGQNEIREYLFTPSDENLFVPQQVVKNGNYFDLTFGERDIDNLFKNQLIVEYEKAFPKLKSNLNKVYRVKVEESSSLTLQDLLNNAFITYAEEMEEPQLASDIVPNDYMFPNGDPNDYLELIRAPLAWSVTKGDPNILVGVADSWFNTVHEELANKMVGIYGDSTAYWGDYDHGIGVASLIAGDTNNNKGMSSIGYNAKMVGYVGAGYNPVYELAMIHGVRIVNMSWSSGYYSQYQDSLYAELRDEYNIVLVGSAGNKSCGGQFEYCYPASYNAVISVTSSGSKYYRGDWDNGHRDWKDCVQLNVLNPESTNTINDKVDVCAPGYNIFRAINTNGSEGSVDTYIDYGGATSQAAPQVAGLAALILSVNPNLTAVEVKEIIKETADNIDNIEWNQDLIGMYGTGRINAYRAVMRAYCMLNPTNDLDLMIRDSREDYGAEPNVETEEVFWNSIDMWVRNQQDEIEIHENPEYDPNNPSYVYVRVFNRSCQTSSGNEKVKLYWAKASTSLDWDMYWNGQNEFSNGQPLGQPIGEITIPELEPGQDVVLNIPWQIPNPSDYASINPDPWHFCLLARIDTPDDPMTYTETNLLRPNVEKNNNIAWKNLTVVDLDPNTLGKPIGGVILVGNPLNQPEKFDLQFSTLKSEKGNNLFNEAEVNIYLDAVVMEAWEKGGFKGQGVRKVGGNRVMITSDDAILEDLRFDANAKGTVNVTFNFLTKEITEKDKFEMNVIQQFNSNKEVLGGETYEVRKHTRSLFYANAGNDKEVDKNETVVLEAQQISEPATYNWYDAEGNLIHEGATFATSVEIGMKYKLEVISLADGFKDYAEVQVELKPDNLQEIYPNPASDNIQVNYKINKGSSAYLSVVGVYGSSASENYILDINQNSINIDVSNYPIGLYTVALIVDGEIVDSKTLIKE